MTVGVVSAAVIAAVLVGTLLKKKGPEVETQVPNAPSTGERARARVPGTMPEKTETSAAARIVPRPEPRTRRERDAVQPVAERQGGTPAVAPAAAEEMTEERIKAVEAWEAFVDKVAEEAEDTPPTAERANRFRREFDKLDKADRLDGIQTSLNLLPDEQFPLLYPILFDKSVDPDILDAIFSDGLNHDDEIKIPMMKEIYKDKTHPMYEEAARILDATGELDEEQNSVKD
jgi:hypothetical protein